MFFLQALSNFKNPGLLSPWVCVWAYEIISIYPPITKMSLRLNWLRYRIKNINMRTNALVPLPVIIFRADHPQKCHSIFILFKWKMKEKDHYIISHKSSYTDTSCQIIFDIKFTLKYLSIPYFAMINLSCIYQRG